MFPKLFLSMFSFLSQFQILFLVVTDETAQIGVSNKMNYAKISKDIHIQK